MSSSFACCYLWRQIGCDYIFANEAHVCVFKRMQMNWGFFSPGRYGNDELSDIHVNWLLARLSSVDYNNWPIANFVCAPTRAPTSSTRPSPCRRAQKKVHCAGRERGKWGLVLVSTQSCIWNTRLPPGVASGAGFLFSLHWAGAEFGPTLWLGESEPLWTPWWLGLPNSNLSITGIQIQTRT